MTSAFEKPAPTPRRRRMLRILIVATACLGPSSAFAANSVTLPDGAVMSVYAPGGYAPIMATTPLGTQAVQLSTLPDTGAGDLSAIRSQTATGNGKLDALHGDDQAFQGAVAMTPGAAQAAQRSIGMACTLSGNVALVFADGSTLAVPVQVGWSLFPFAVTTVATAGTTAACVYSNLK